MNSALLIEKRSYLANEYLLICISISIAPKCRFKNKYFLKIHDLIYLNWYLSLCARLAKTTLFQANLAWDKAYLHDCRSWKNPLVIVKRSVPKSIYPPLSILICSCMSFNLKHIIICIWKKACNLYWTKPATCCCRHTLHSQQNENTYYISYIKYQLHRQLATA